ncbi:MAG: sugar ABC transporter permease [Candidatus Atribacteria bacterium]|nr:sugar ABC transporter permease [Candidatus Atribacteria bacterium]
MQKRLSKTGLILILPSIIYLFFLSLYPTIYTVFLSSKEFNLARPHKSVFVGIGNFIRLFQDDLFRRSLLNTLVIAVFSIVLELIFGYIVAEVFDKRLKGMEALRTIYMLPMMVTPVVWGLVWVYIFNPNFGLANYIFEKVGLGFQPWFASGGTAILSLILVNIWQWTPFTAIIFLAGLSGIPNDIYDAANVDGAKWYQLIFSVKLPALKQMAMVTILIRLMDNLRLFDLVYSTTQGGPGSSTETMSFFIYRHGFKFFNLGYSSTAAILVLVFIILVSQYLIRLFYQGGEIGE